MQTLKAARHMATPTAVKQAVSDFIMPVPWGEMRGKVWGPDHGRPVLCLHGWADNCGTFNTLIPLLPKEYRYVAVDLPGHGQSSHRPPGVFYSFPAYLADVRRVIEALQWTRFTIIGHSMGGNIAGMISALYPEMVDAVVLLDSYGFLPTDPKELTKVMKQGMDQMITFEKQQEKKEKVYTYEKAFERVLAANPALSEQSVHILLERGISQVEGGVVFTRDFRINLHVKNVMHVSLEQCLEMQSQLQAPFFVILADEGFEKIFAGPELKKYISTLLQRYRERNDTVITVQGDHHIHLNRPECVASFVSEFLQTVLSQSHSPAGDTPIAKL